MSIKRVTPDEVSELLEQGWKYIDVRSIPEFEQGHPTGAYNVPLLFRGPGGMAPNPDFLAVMKSAFAPEDKLVIGCRSGNRSLRAAGMLVDSGFTNVVDMRGGFGGERAPGGQITCEGWESRKLPVASAAEPGRSYSELKE